MTRNVAEAGPRAIAEGPKSSMKNAIRASSPPTSTQAKKIQKLFGEHLRALRLAAGLSQAALAEESGVDRTFLSQIERGIRQPSLTSLYRIAKALDTTVKALVSCVDDVQPG